MTSFDMFDLAPALNAGLARIGYATPTPIQEKAIPHALVGRDIMGSAQTGTGKTAAFAIPLLDRLLRQSRGSALVLSPTRELGKQIIDFMHQLLGTSSPIKTAFLIGGESMGKQLEQLRTRPRLIVGTPGRINDHLERGSLMLHDAGFLVLDETDRMLDLGFAPQLEKIFKYLPAHRQTLMFSATLPQNILKLSEKYLNNPERIAVGSTIAPAVNIQQDVIRVSDEGKFTALTDQLNARSGSVIVFVKTKFGTEKLAKKLRGLKFTAEAIHGDLRQNVRDNTINGFRHRKYRILVATDIAARGLDIPHIEHVINYDLPQVPEDYIHRIGRTARAGAQGSAVCLLAPPDALKWQAIEKMMNPGQPRAATAPGASKSGNGRRRRFYRPKKTATA